MTERSDPVYRMTSDPLGPDSGTLGQPGKHRLSAAGTDYTHLAQGFVKYVKGNDNLKSENLSILTLLLPAYLTMTLDY